MNSRRSEILNEAEFRRFLHERFEASAYDCFDRSNPENAKYPPDVGHHHLCETRCFLVYRELARLTSGSIRHMDLGFYPGILVRILKALLGDGIESHGAGNQLTPEFRDFISSSLATTQAVDFDPFYSQTPARIDHPDESFDVVTATEILEHLISPLELIAEGARVLRPGGLFIITTPNVSHFYAVVRILFGLSNYERIHHSPMCQRGNEGRGHIRFYDRRELVTLFAEQGLTLLTHRYYNEKGERHIQKSAARRAALAFKWPFMAIPHYRNSHFAAFRRG